VIRRLAALAAAGILLASCGDDTGRFDEQVQRVRDAVESGDRDAAQAELDGIALLALDARASGELTDAEVEEVGRLVDQGRSLLDEELPAPTTTTTTTTTTTVAPSPPAVDRDDDDEGGRDGGRGKGKKGHDEGDDD